jgi:hypothetical protein
MLLVDKSTGALAGAAGAVTEVQDEPEATARFRRTQDLAGAPIGVRLRSVHGKPRTLSEHLARAMARRDHYRRLEEGLLVGIPLPPIYQLEVVLDRLEDRDWVDYLDLAGACIETIDRLVRLAGDHEAVQP